MPSLIGFGAIARAVADMLQSFGVTVYYTKRHRLSPEEGSTVSGTVSFDG
ncbi:MAG: NAD(P)-dependent oxidoreductase [Clostridium sp.]